MPEQVTEDMGALARGVSVNLYGSGFNMATRLMFNVLVARLLGPDHVGIYFIALSVANLLGVLAAGGLDTTLVRYLSRQRASGDWGRFRGTLRFVLQIAASISLAATTFILVGAPWIAAKLLHNPEVKTPLRIIAFWVPLYVAENLMLAATQSFREMKYKVYIDSFLDPSLRFVLVIIVYFLGGGLNAILSAYVFSLLVCAVLAAWALRRCIPVPLAAYSPITSRREILGFSSPLFAYNVLTGIALYADSLLVAHFRSAAEVGTYSVAVRVVAVTGFITPVLGQIFGPICSELHHRGDLQQLANAFTEVTLMAVPLFLPILLLLMVGHSPNYLTGPSGLVLNMAGWTRLQLYNVTFSACLQTALDLLLIPRFGIMGAAAASCTSLMSLNLIQLYQLNRRLHFHPFSRALAKPFLAALAAGAAAVLVWKGLTLGPLLSPLLMGSVTILTYMVTLVALGLDRHSRLALEHVRSVIGMRFRRTPQTVLTER